MTTHAKSLTLKLRNLVNRPKAPPEPEPLNPQERERIENVQAVVKAGGPEAAKMLADALADPYAGFRRLVADSLVAVGASAVPTLTVLVADPRPDVRRWAAELLGRLNDPAATGPLLVRLTDPDPGVRATVAEALGKLADKRAVEPLVWMSRQDPEERCRASAIWALHSIGDVMLRPHLPMLASKDLATRMRAREAVCAKGKGVVLAVADLLQHEDPIVRRTAAEILGTIGDERPLDALLAASDDPDSGVRGAASQALRGYRSEKTVRVLIARLAQPDTDVAAEAAAALAAQGEIAVPSLVELLGSERRELQATAADVLGKIGDARATDSLLKLLDHSDAWVRTSAARALGGLKDKKAAERLIGLLRDATSSVRVAAAEALGEMKVTGAVKPLLELLRHREMALQVVVARALGRIADPAAFGALVDAVEQGEVLLRIAAIEALVEYRDQRVVPFLKKMARPWPLSTESEAVKAAARLALARLQPKI